MRPEAGRVLIMGTLAVGYTRTEVADKQRCLGTAHAHSAGMKRLVLIIGLGIVLLATSAAPLRAIDWSSLTESGV